MVLFYKEEQVEEKEMEYITDGNLFLEKLILKGEEKTTKPHHRNKRLRNWPSDSTRKEVYEEIYLQEIGTIPNREGIEKWKTEKASEFWETVTEGMEEEEKTKVLVEYGITYISSLITNTIHLENLYRALKPLGQKQWAVSQKEIKNLAEENSLLSLTDASELLTQEGKKRILPDWIKGTILYLSYQGSRNGKDMLNPKTKNIPDMNALKTAANWCLGTHLNLSGDKKNLEETIQIFEKWHVKRENIQLELVKVDMKKIPEELQIPPPTMNDGTLPWNLCWRIIPVFEDEIRDLGLKFLSDKEYYESMTNKYKKRIFDRWVTNIIRRGYLRKFSEQQNVEERWKTTTLILNPIDNYIPNRITADNKTIKLMAKTESAWLMITEKLPEPEH